MKYPRFTCKIVISILVLSVTMQSEYAYACSSCGCSFNSDWASEGYSNNCGWRFDSRFDYIDQNSIRYGSSHVSKESFEVPNENEVQQHTITRQTLFGLDYSPDMNWGIHLTMPYINRTHSTLGEDNTELSHSGTSGVGDSSVVARYQGFSPLANLGVQFGLKIPTGAFTNNFNSGPLEGERIDRGLQNGSGTTDGILGVYYFGTLYQEMEYFGQVIANQPFQAREGFKFGTSVSTSTGLNFRLNNLVRPQIQINHKFEARESGESADRPNSGGNAIGLTPGVDIKASKNIDVYLLVHVPLYQQVNGYQIVPHDIASVGVRYSF